MIKWNIVRRSDDKVIFTSTDLEEIMDKKEEAISIHGSFNDYIIQRIDVKEDNTAQNVEDEVVEDNKEDKEIEIQKVYIKNFGNLVLEILGSSDIGLHARSTKRKETLFIPWTSIIFCSKLDDVSEY